MKTVYLAGPIAGLSYDGATNWRDYACKQLGPGISGISPLRSKLYLKGVADLSGTFDEEPLSTGKAITRRDHWDCVHSDLVLANVKGAQKVSMGTVMEMAWAYDHKKLLIVVMENGNIHTNPMVMDAATYIVDDLDKGLWIANSILTDYVFKSKGME